MGYVYTAIVALLFSTSGLFSKIANTMVSPVIISHARFLFGVMFLLIACALKRKKIRLHVFCAPIVLGAVCKALNYLFENYGVSMGYSYGNIIIWPVQTIFTLLYAVLIMHERATRKQLIGAVLCIFGVFLIAWNGTSLSVLFGENIMVTLLFVAAGLFVAGFTIVQKKLIGRFDAIEMNLSFFLVATVVTFIPVTAVGEFTGNFSFGALGALLMMGFTTGIGQMFVIRAMERIPMFLFSVLQSGGVIFSLIWAFFLYHEPVSFITITGTLIFLIGMALCIKRNREENSTEKST